jgi:plastocyanin
MGIRRVLVGAALAVGLTLPHAGLVSGPTDALALGQMDVAMELSEFAFAPDTITVGAGQTVTFALANVGANPHQLHIAGMGAEWTSDRLESGQSGSLTVTFAEAGSYEMWCPVGSHRDRGMVGSISVGA